MIVAKPDLHFPPVLSVWILSGAQLLHAPSTDISGSSLRSQSLQLSGLQSSVCFAKSMSVRNYGDSGR